jgi:hypothetical protein
VQERGEIHQREGILSGGRRDQQQDKEKISSKKLSFVYRVPGKDLIVIAGFFE